MEALWVALSVLVHQYYSCLFSCKIYHCLQWKEASCTWTILNPVTVQIEEAISLWKQLLFLIWRQVSYGTFCYAWQRHNSKDNILQVSSVEYHGTSFLVDFLTITHEYIVYLVCSIYKGRTQRSFLFLECYFFCPGAGGGRRYSTVALAWAKLLACI